MINVAYAAARPRPGSETASLETTRWLRPRLLILDPLVRLHGVDENNAGAEGGTLLAYFRSLQADSSTSRCCWCITRA